MKHIKISGKVFEQEIDNALENGQCLVATLNKLAKISAREEKQRKKAEEKESVFKNKRK